MSKALFEPDAIRRHSAELDELSFMPVEARIMEQVVTTGYLTRCHRFSEWLDLYADRNDIVFYRRVKKFLDIYSYTERTLSLHPSVYKLLIDLGVRLIVTDFLDNDSVVAKVADFRTESDLGIGFLRRCPIAATQQITASAVPIRLSQEDRVATVYAAEVESEMKRKIESRHDTFFDPRQSQLF